MDRRDIVVIGGSAGSLLPVLRLASALPQDFQAAVFVAIHGRSLGGVMSLKQPRVRLPVRSPADGDPILPGHIYLAHGGHNTLIERGRIRVLASPREYWLQPSINALFRSAAVAYGPRVVGVVLSGLLDDGTAGLWAIKQHGGVAIVQSPEDADYPEMVRSALGRVQVDYSVAASNLAPLLVRLASEPVGPDVAYGTHPADVLIVEDEAIVAMNLERGLTARGYRVTSVVSAAEAAIAAVRADPPDVVLMDIVLPGSMDGTVAARVISDEFGVPVVYVTAHGDEETLARVRATAPYGYVLKPFDMGQVHAALQLALDRREKESLPS